MKKEYQQRQTLAREGQQFLTASADCEPSYEAVPDFNEKQPIHAYRYVLFVSCRIVFANYVASTFGLLSG